MNFKIQWLLQDKQLFNFFCTIAEEVVRVKGQNVGTVSTEECLPPAQVFASEEVPSLLEPLFPANAEPKVCFST